MHNCEVVQCGKSSDDEVSLHRIPKSGSQNWSTFLQTANSNYLKWKCPKKPLICHHHFSPSCMYVLPTGRRCIKKGHNPSLLSGQTAVTRCFECDPVPEPVLMDVDDNPTITLESTNVDDPYILIAAMDEEIANLQEKVAELREQRRVLSQRLSRISESRKRSSEVIKDLRAQIKVKHPKIGTKTSATQTDVSIEVDSHLWTFCLEIIHRKSYHGKYSQLIQEFSIKLHYLSPRAYTFTREFLENTLPDPKTFSRWTKHIDTRPGFFPASLKFISQCNTQRQMLYNLILDEMYIRKKITWDGQKMHGYADYGSLVTSIPDDDAEAKTALFFMVTEIHGMNAIPIGYILLDRLDGEMIADGIKQSLIKLDNANAKVIGVTFDGLKSNFAAAKSLGANLDVTSGSFQTFFPHPVSRDPVYIHLDSSHMMKLMRNQLKDCQTFFDSSENGMRASNRLTVRHDTFETQKMKTRLAVQTISNSTAVAMLVCKKLGLGQFEKCDHTANFFRVQDRAFDLTNSRRGGKGYKSPLNLSNRCFWSRAFKESKDMLLSLKYLDKRTNEKVRFVESIKGTFAKGMIITMTSLEGIMEFYGENQQLLTLVLYGKLKYLPTYKISQDFLEMFFAKVRSRLGCNDNPSSFELLHLLKYVLAIRLKLSPNANCVKLDETDTGFGLSAIGTSGALSGHRTSTDHMEPELDYLPSYETMSLFVKNVVVYIAGYVCRDLCNTLQCATCILALLPINRDSHGLEFTLINEKDNGGLCLPSTDVIVICKLTESYIRASKESGTKHMDIKKIMNKVSIECSELGVFKDVNHDDRSEAMVHTNDLIRKVTATYSKVRLHYIANDATLRISPSTNRNVCTKAVHFGGN